MGDGHMIYNLLLSDSDSCSGKPASSAHNSRFRNNVIIHTIRIWHLKALAIWMESLYINVLDHW